MKIQSLFLALVVAVIAAGTVATTKADYYNDGYRRGGLFGSGGFLGTGVGRDRYNDRYYDNGYYGRRSVVGGAAATAGNVVEDVTGLPTGDDSYYNGYRGYRGYRRGW